MKLYPFYREIAFGIALCLGLSFYPAEVAHALTPTEEQELRDKSRRALEDRERVVQEKDVFLQPKIDSEMPKVLPEEENSFPIDQIILEGDSVSRFGWAQRLLDQYAGQRIGAEGLNLILKDLTNEFINRGYVTTRVQVGEQDLSTGILRIQLIPGRVRNIRFAEEGQQGSWWTAFPTKPGRILNLRDLEQGLEQMKRLPSQDVTMDLAPGDQPGESDVVISLKKGKAWRAAFSVDDSGSRSTGKYQGSTSLTIDNLFGHNDMFSYTYVHDLDTHSSLKSSSNHNYYYSMPYGKWTFSFTALPSKYRQNAGGLYTDLTFSGESQTYTLKAQRILQRDADSKIMMDFQIGRKFSKSFVADYEIENQRRDTTFLEMGISRRKNFSTGLLDMRLGGRRGIPWLGGMGDPEWVTSDYPSFEYFIGTFDLNIVQQFERGKTPLRYSFDFRGQATQSSLYGSELFSIGNRYTVRGFEGEETLAAENGFYIRNEISIPVEKLRSELYIGLDYGQVTGPSAKYLVGNKLAGSAIGLRGGCKGFYYDVFAGFPLYKPKKLDAADVVYGFQLGYQY